MRIEHWKHESVRPDGTFIFEEGAVKVDKGITLSSPIKGGCGIDNCKCSEGHWMCISFGYDSKDLSVSGITVYFDNHIEMMTSLGKSFN